MRVQIKHSDGIVTTIAGKAEIAVGDESDAVRSAKSGNCTSRLVGLGINHSNQACGGVARVESLPTNCHAVDARRAHMKWSRHFDSSHRSHSFGSGARG